MLTFKWTHDDTKWVLEPHPRDDGWRITVEPQPNGWWSIMFGGRRLGSNYTSEQGAKLDAWEYVKSHAVMFFNTRRIKLEE